MATAFYQTLDLLSVSPFVALPAVFAAGILTSLSPCVLPLIPLLIGYIGGSAKGAKKGLLMSLSFVAGLGITFAILGIMASYMGSIFGQIGSGWFVFLALLAIVMGLQLLGVINLNFPGLKRLPFKASSPSGALLTGAAFGLIASPCATPMLAAILTFVSVQRQVVYGGLLLFTYGLGLGGSLMVVGSFTALLKEMPHFSSYSKYFTQFSGIILILFGLFLLYRIL